MRRPGSRGSISRPACTARQSTFGDLFAEVFTRRAATAARHARGADLHADADAAVRRGAAGRRATVHGHAAGALRDVRGGRNIARPRLGVHAVPRHRPAARGAGPHGLLPHVPAVSRRGRPARGVAAARAAAPGCTRAPSRSTLRVPAGAPTARGCVSPTSGTPARRAGHPEISTSRVQVLRRIARFRREGDDLHVLLPLAVHEAALGRADRDCDAERPGPRARAARHAVGAALPPAGPRRPVAAERPTGRSRDRDAHHAAAAARRAIERAAAGVRTINGSANVRSETAADPPPGTRGSM